MNETDEKIHKLDILDLKKNEIIQAHASGFIFTKKDILKLTEELTNFIPTTKTVNLHKK